MTRRKDLGQSGDGTRDSVRRRQESQIPLTALDRATTRYGERTVQTLADVLSFAEQAERLVERGRDAFEDDEFLRLASEALIHRIGEAVARLPKEFKDGQPQISWRGMRGTRSIVSHNYDAVDYKIIWAALTKNLPQDAQHIRKILTDPAG